LGKLIAEALPLPEAPPAVRSVHLYKLLCGGNLDRSYSNALLIMAFLREETGKTRKQGDGSLVADSRAKCGLPPTSAASFGQIQGCVVLCHKRDRHLLVNTANCM
jgi:hypothetical protein